MAFFAFVFVVATIAVLPEFLEERRKAKERKKCPRCKKNIYCKKHFDKEVSDEDEDEDEREWDEWEEDNTLTHSSSFVQITKNGKTVTIINAKRIK